MNVALTRPFKPVFQSVVITAFLGLAACTPAPTAHGISDPHEAANRRTHQANLKFDQAVFGPVSDAYGSAIPEPIRDRVDDFSDNTALPGIVVNQLLQGKIEDAVHNTARFLFNTTLGLGGLFDIANDIGLEERDTDFGETLHVWGFAEGDYVVLPFFGPSTERDAFGTAVDFFTNPLSYVLKRPESYVPTGAKIMTRFGDRYTYGDTFDAVLYESADGYLTAQLYYLDNRRYDLGDDSPDEELYDLYEESYE